MCTKVDSWLFFLARNVPQIHSMGLQEEKGVGLSTSNTALEDQMIIGHHKVAEGQLIHSLHISEANISWTLPKLFCPEKNLCD